MAPTPLSLSVTQSAELEWTEKVDPKITRGKKSKWNGMRAVPLSKAHDRIPKTLTVRHITPMALFALKVSSPRLRRVGSQMVHVSILQGLGHERLR